jgi:hypothetical protein
MPNTVEPAKKVKYFSWDFDNCVYNQAGYHKSDEKDVLKANKALFEKIRGECAGIKLVFYMVGSLRQSVEEDNLNRNMNKTGSCFQDLKVIAAAHGVTIDGCSCGLMCDYAHTGTPY